MEITKEKGLICIDGYYAEGSKVGSKETQIEISNIKKKKKKKRGPKPKHKPK